MNTENLKNNRVAAMPYSLKKRVSFFNVQKNPFSVYINKDRHVQSFPASKLGKTL
jgi:hypothetical protein